MFRHVFATNRDVERACCSLEELLMRSEQLSASIEIIGDLKEIRRNGDTWYRLRLGGAELFFRTNRPL